MEVLYLEEKCQFGNSIEYIKLHFNHPYSSSKLVPGDEIHISVQHQDIANKVEGKWRLRDAFYEEPFKMQDFFMLTIISIRFLQAAGCRLLHFIIIMEVLYLEEKCQFDNSIECIELRFYHPYSSSKLVLGDEIHISVQHQDIANKVEGKWRFRDAFFEEPIKMQDFFMLTNNSIRFLQAAGYFVL
uniref:Uncharacterized protein n=1 Tax=Rhodnius prolixus TaxID=13249 RepID=T1I3Z3_RHOPR